MWDQSETAKRSASTHDRRMPNHVLPAKLSLVAAATIAVAVLAPQSASAATTRHVVPNGMSAGTCATSATACTLRYAVETAAAAGDTVAVGSGNYPLNLPLNVPVANLAIVGAPGTRPQISFSAAQSHATGVSATGAGMSIRHLAIRASGVDMTALRVAGGTFDDLDLRAPGDGSTAAFTTGGSTFSNTALSAGVNGQALWAGGGDSSLRNVTAWSSGTGIYAGSGGGGDPVVHLLLHNSIAHGSQADLGLQSGGTQSTRVSVDADHSNYRPATVFTSNTFAAVYDKGGNSAAAPLLANPAGGDLHQLTGSPTIDSGSHVAADGTRDFDGEARVQGRSTDMGADEFTVAAPRFPSNGAAPRRPVSVTPDRAPALGALKLSPTTFAVAQKSKQKKKPAKGSATGGTRITYRDSEAATTRFTVQQRARVKRRGRRVLRWVKVRGSFSHRDHAGKNVVAFKGRLRGRALKPGRYRLVGVARDRAGHKSTTRRARFRITG